MYINNLYDVLFNKIIKGIPDLGQKIVVDTALKNGAG